MPPRDWKKLVEESGGLMKFVPAELIDKMKQWQADRLEFNKFVDVLAKKENALSTEFTNLIFALRTYFESAGLDGVWSMDCGVNTDALKDGEYIINFTPNQKS